MRKPVMGVGQKGSFPLGRLILLAVFIFFCSLTNLALAQQETQAYEEDRYFHEEYTLQPGDVIEITVYEGAGEVERKRGTEKFTISGSGEIFYELIGSVKISGKTSSQLEGEITENLKQYIRGPRAIVRIIEYAGRAVLVFGEVNKVGIYPLKENIRIAEFLASIGGTSRDADIRRVIISRNNGEIVRFNLEKFLFDNDNSKNVILEEGDKIIVLKKKQGWWDWLKVNLPVVTALLTITMFIITLGK